MPDHDRVLVPGGSFRMGSRDFYREEAPIRAMTVRDLLVDRHPVTNQQFGQFIADTGHLTVAETAPDPGDFPDADEALLVPGSQVFTGTARPVPLNDWTQWWSWIPGTSWAHPEGPDTDLTGRDLHPVVHVGWQDARAYAAWADARLPSESEWEYVARGGLDDATYAWGEEFQPGGVTMAKTWQGRFPYDNTAPPGLKRTSPTGAFAANGYGLYDMTGNVWEWTATQWTDDHTTDAPAAHCCGPTKEAGEHDRYVIKGGSHLCAPEYCHRYRPAARQGHGARDTAGHVGFRCVVDAA